MLRDKFIKITIAFTVSIFRLFFVKDNVEELALRSRAAGAIGGIGGANGV